MDYKILIVDDKKEYLQTAMQYIIEDSIPYALLCALNGESGVDIATKEIPDIIIMDWEMPGMSGIDAIRELKQNEQTKDIPVIISTGLRMLPSDLKVAFDAGASDFIRKPLEKTEFISRISSHLKMADYLKTIKLQENIIAQGKINHLNEKIDSLQSKIDNDNTLILFFNDTLQSILKKLEKANIENHNSQKEIQEISTILKQSINSLKQNFSNQSAPGKLFVKRLLEKHANLTHQEIQLCFMLKNKLSTKDIATITFREESSVKVSRSRLRKKLELKGDENLLTYIDRY